MKQNNQEKKLKFIFFRHGETPWNKENRAQGSSNDPVNNGLTQEGKSDVELSSIMLYNYFLLDGVNPENIYVYTTPMHRTYDTAKIISKVLELPKGNILVHPDLSGRSYGKIEGVKDVKNVKTIAKNPGLGLAYVLSELGIRENGKGIETKPDFQQRIFNALNDVYNDAVDNQAEVVILACNSDVWDVIRSDEEFEYIFDLDFNGEILPGSFVQFDANQLILDTVREYKVLYGDNAEIVK